MPHNISESSMFVISVVFSMVEALREFGSLNLAADIREIEANDAMLSTKQSRTGSIRELQLLIN